MRTEKRIDHGMAVTLFPGKDFVIRFDELQPLCPNITHSLYVAILVSTFLFVVAFEVGPIACKFESINIDQIKMFAIVKVECPLQKTAESNRRLWIRESVQTLSLV